MSVVTGLFAGMADHRGTASNKYVVLWASRAG